MKKKLAEIRQKTIIQLENQVEKLKIDLARQRAELSASGKKDFKKIKKIKLEIAQNLTIIREKQIIDKESQTK